MVARVDNKNNNPKIILSRTSPVFLQRLFEMEVPEINDGLITIKKIARIPGERAKIAVESYDDRIDPVGACVGVKGSRIHGIVRELRNENIDVINYTSNISLFIQRALSPAKISSIRLNEEEKKAEVFLKPEEVSLAIGKGGLNIKLASMLTEYTIDVFRELDENVADEDIYLDEFRDEIDGWVIDAIKAIGIDTAKAVFNVDNYKEYLSLQCDSALRNVVRVYPYDVSPNVDTTGDGVADEGSLRGSSEVVAARIRDEIQKNVAEAGIEVVEARINYLAYAPEIAAVMLRRQQASAIITAREKIVEGAVSMVKMALHKLSEEEIVELDEDKKAAMVSNLLVVLCADEPAQPVINSGTLNH